jgi:hypothetical protein
MEKNFRPVEDFLDEGKAKGLRSKLLYWRFQRLADMGDVGDVFAVSPRVSPLNFHSVTGDIRSCTPR